MLEKKEKVKLQLKDTNKILEQYSNKESTKRLFYNEIKEEDFEEIDYICNKIDKYVIIHK